MAIIGDELTHRGRSLSRALAAFLLAAAVSSQARAQDRTLVRYHVTPESTDSSIHRFNDAHYVVFERSTTSAAPLLVFMPGTGGMPQRTSDFADLAAHQGYRVIGLEYTDEPAVAQICPRDRNPDCSANFRQKRIFGDDVTDVIDDRPSESVVNRLVKLLSLLQREHPLEMWSSYLIDGQPDWSRIAVSGLSQGAGMAAYIAQKKRVARVILFSSPWDNYGPRQTLAPWLRAGHGETPSELWFAAFHAKEPTAALIARAYSALEIPQSQIRVFSLDPAPTAPPTAYHPSVVANGPTPRTADGQPAYLDDWRFLLGVAH
jgi:dienelactone hydrolase